jgi:hypothetical protein
MPHPPRGTTNQKINFWAMMNNVIIQSLVKGQLIPVLLFFLLLIMVIKMPPADVTKVMAVAWYGLKSGYLVGYALSLALGAGWQWHVRWQRRNYETRLRDMAKARDEAQEHALPGLLESSNKPAKQKGKKNK